MRRSYTKPTLFDARKLGKLGLTLLVAFTAYKILTPPSRDLARIASPDGSMTARLRRIDYFAGRPSYKIYYREKGRRTWRTLLHLPTYTNAPPDAPATLEWGGGSDRLDFLIGGTSVWHRAFGK